MEDARRRRPGGLPWLRRPARLNAIAYLTGDLTEEGFSLKGGPAFMLFAIIILYFIVFARYLGGTVWQRLLRALRRRAEASPCKVRLFL